MTLEEGRRPTTAFWVGLVIACIVTAVLAAVIDTWWKYLLVVGVLAELLVVCLRLWRRRRRSIRDNSDEV